MSTRLTVLLSGGALVALVLGIRVAVAVLGDGQGVPVEAQGLGQIQLSYSALELPPEEEDEDRKAVPLWPLGEVNRDRGAYNSSYELSPSVYFQRGKFLGLNIANTAGVAYRSSDWLNGRFRTPNLNGNSFFTRPVDTPFTANAIASYTLPQQPGAASDPAVDEFFGNQFGVDANWNFIDDAPRVSLTYGRFRDNPQQDLNAITGALSRQPGISYSGFRFTTDLTRDVERIDILRGPAGALYGGPVSVGDGFRSVVRTDDGSRLTIKRNYLSPENAIFSMNHDFSYRGPSTFTDRQVEFLATVPSIDPRVPEDALQPDFYATPVGDMTIVESGFKSLREYYYETPEEWSAITEDSIADGLGVVQQYENRIAENFNGYEPSNWAQGAAQPVAAATRRAEPQADPKKLPNDGYFHASGSWGQDYDDQWGLKQIGFTAAGRDGKGALWPRKAAATVVAVVDTGIDFGHPELYGVLWANFSDIPNNGKDDDGNGYIDDFLGWNFVDGNNNVRDDNGHGTFVAGIIAAATDNGFGIAGVNPWARILPVKVTDFDNIGASADIAAGIVYAARLGARVINVSIAGPLNKVEQAAVGEAVKLGALVVVAAGNDGADTKDVAPAGLDGVMTVAATDHNRERAQYSNWGDNIDIAAPGSDILSLRAIQTDLMQFADKDYQRGANAVGSERLFYRSTGTSFAAPYVSGVASLLFSLNPQLTPAQVERMILQSASDIDVGGTDQFTGYGLLNAPAAIEADPEFFVEARIDGVAAVQQDGSVQVQVSGTADADRLKKAWIEIGPGENPDQWKKVGGNIKKVVRAGVLGTIAAKHFGGAEVWTLRLVTEHKNGRKRENRFLLRLG